MQFMDPKVMDAVTYARYIQLRTKVTSCVVW